MKDLSSPPTPTQHPILPAVLQPPERVDQGRLMRSCLLERWQKLRGRRAAGDKRADAEALLGDIEACLAPANGKQVTGRAFALLSQYYVGDIPSEAHAMIFADWREGLSGLPFWALDAACKSYLSGRNCKKKPQPGIIRALAVEEVTELQAIAERIKQVHQKLGLLSDQTQPSGQCRIYPQAFIKSGDTTRHA